MKSVSTLPEGYLEIYSVDLEKNKKMMLAVNGIALLIAAALVVPALFIVPIGSLFDMEAGLVPYILRFVTLGAGAVLYVVLHELTHGAAMKISGTEKIKYGFTVKYAYAGSDDYYGKGAYIFIALAPVVLFGIIFGALALILEGGWFWVVWLLEVFNLSGAAGDFFVTVRFIPLPRDILVKDHGTGMTVYSATRSAED